MKYVVRSIFIENTHEEEVDEHRFNQIKHSRNVLSAALQIENVFDNLLSNYLEVETRCLELTAHRLVRRSIGYRDGNEALASINLVFVNYLSTARAYIDKIPKTASRCFEGIECQTIKGRLEEALSIQYDSHFDYRFMEALRNYVQHSGSALHMLRTGASDLKQDEQSVQFQESFLEPICSKSILLESGDFKAKVLAECPSLVNLLDCTRVHVRSLSHVQQIVRTLTAEATADAKLQMKNGQALLEGKVTGSLDGVEAVSRLPTGEASETVSMLLKWEEVRAWLAQRNPGMASGLRKYPSGRGSL